jgi:acetyl-CoA carboxylase carboxyl transferase subunit beta
MVLMFDEGVWQVIEVPKGPVDPLRFRDLRKYADRLREAQTRTGCPEALVVARGTIGSFPVIVAAMNFAFMGGSMGAGVGDAMLLAARQAASERVPLIIVTASGGARMQEGILSLMQMARTTIAVDEVRAAGVPCIVLLTDPTTGGVSASFAMLGDITLAEPGAVIGFAGSRVIEQTIRQTLPERFQKAEYLFEHGMIDMVVPRTQLRETLARIIGLLLDPSGERIAALREGSPTPVSADANADRTGVPQAHVAE